MWLLDPSAPPRGEFSTRSISAYPSGGAVCLSSLSEVLEIGDVPKRYFLSAKACRGILRRAAKRGRELPPQLERSLRAVADGEPEPMRPPAGKSSALTSKTPQSAET
ncbi:MAG: hypothetical protein Q7R41_20335, partial [Phycisphaerales bacterium]|nr:hypothetical protein [Phycisphaerales bacterium]